PLPSQLPRSCLNYPMPTGQLRDQGGHLAGPGVGLWERILQDATTRGSQTMFTIHPSAIPAGAGLWINVSPPAQHGPGSDFSSAAVRLVYASGRCPSAKAPTSSDIGVVGGINGGN